MAQQIVEGAADELTLAAKTVIDELRFDGPLDIVLSGGILTHQPTFVDLLRDRLQAVAPNAHIGLAKHEPAYGAVLLAKSAYEDYLLATDPEIQREMDEAIASVAGGEYVTLEDLLAEQKKKDANVSDSEFQ